jgi:hypothetical protein
MEVNNLCNLMTLHEVCGHARSFAIALDRTKGEIKKIIIKNFNNSIIINPMTPQTLKV